MENNLNDLMNTISQLPDFEKNKLLTFLLYEKSAMSNKDKETIEVFLDSSEKFKKWIEDTDKTIKETEVFLNELRKSV